MGLYLNPSNRIFQMDLNSKIYIDKSNLIQYTNSVLDTNQRFICVSRPRRFGKSITANMLSAYYARTESSKELFSKLNISTDKTFETHLNKYNVIFLNIQNFVSKSKNIENMIKKIEHKLVLELEKEYPNSAKYDDDLSEFLEYIYIDTKIPFVIIIDEWDCIFRVYKENKEGQELYLDYLRLLFKDRLYVGLVYMTGILPIKKYGTHSAINMFDEFSMLDANKLAEYTGFTENEVKILCEQYDMDFEETKVWYDGYYLEEVGSIYSPRSVSKAMLAHKFGTYWNQTETFEALKIYINMNFKGLKDSIIKMMAGDRIKINTGLFTNDMTTFSSISDVCTLLVHLGYLAYDFENKEVFIPNKEISQEYISAIEDSGWNEVINSINMSESLLEAVWNLDEEAVAHGVEEAHTEMSHIQYNNENSLSCVLSLAFYTARQYYNVIRELPTGKGYADLVFIPYKKYNDKPALIIELKYDKTTDSAINQIKDKEYTKALKDFSGNILLVAINYDKKSKKHTCIIEKHIKK